MGRSSLAEREALCSGRWEPQEGGGREGWGRLYGRAQGECRCIHRLGEALEVGRPERREMEEKVAEAAGGDGQADTRVYLSPGESRGEELGGELGGSLRAALGVEGRGCEKQQGGMWAPRKRH